MANSAELLINIQAQNKQALKSLGQLNRSVRSMSKNTSRSFKNMNKGATTFQNNMKAVASNIASYFLVRGLVRASAHIFEIASASEEVNTRYQVVMRDMEASTNQFIDSAVTNLGLFKTDLQDSISVVQNITEAMGFSEKQANKFSTAITSLSNDMASFFDLPVSESFRALRSGLVGETEPLRRLGVLTTENALAHFALQKGITKTVRTMSEQEKMVLRLLAITEQTSNAQGDLARTLESPANLVRIFKSRVKALENTLGKLIMQGLKPLFKYLIVIAQALDMVGQRILKYFGITDKVIEDVAGSSKDLDKLTQPLEDAKDASDRLNESMKGNLQSFDELNVLSQPATGLDSLESIGLGEEFEKIFDEIDYQSFLEGVDGALQLMLADSKETLSKMATYLNETFNLDNIFNSIIELGKSLYEFVTSKGFIAFSGAILKILEWLAQLSTSITYVAIQGLADILKTLADLMNGDFKSARESLEDGINRIKDSATKLKDSIETLIYKGFEKLVTWLSDTYDEAKELNGITETLALVGLAVLTGMIIVTGVALSTWLISNLIALSWLITKTVITSIFSLAKTLGKLILALNWKLIAIFAVIAGLIYFWQTSEKFRMIVVASIEAVKFAFIWLWEKAKWVVGKIIDGFSLLGKAGVSLQGMFRHMGNVIVNIFENMLERIKAVLNTLIYILKFLVPEVFYRLKDLVFDVLFSLADKIKDAFNSIIGIVADALNKIADKANKIIDPINEVADIIGFTIPRINFDLNKLKVPDSFLDGLHDAVSSTEKLNDLEKAKKLFTDDNTVIGINYSKNMGNFKLNQLQEELSYLEGIEDEMNKIDASAEKLKNTLGATKDQTQLAIDEAWAKSLNKIEWAGTDDARLDFIDNIINKTKDSAETVSDEQPQEFKLDQATKDDLVSGLGNSILQALSLMRNGESTGDLILNVDTTSFARVAISALEKAQRDSGNDLVTRGV